MVDLWQAPGNPIPGPPRPGKVIAGTRPKLRWDQVSKTAASRPEGWSWAVERKECELEIEAVVKTTSSPAIRSLVRRLKRADLHDGSNAADLVTLLDNGIGASHVEIHEHILASRQTILGGYKVATPNWGYPHRTMARLGAHVPNLAPVFIDDVPYLRHFSPFNSKGGGAWSRSAFRRLAAKAAAQNEHNFATADIVVFSGHHYASHKIPGMFTDIETTRSVDLRYSLSLRPHGFANVKLVFVTGCSLLCALSQMTLRRVFPNAVFIGQRHTMHMTGGSVSLKAFEALATSTPDPASPRLVLLDNFDDFEYLAKTWESSTATALGRRAVSPGPGSVFGSRVRFVVDDIPLKLKTVNAMSPKDNGCQRKAIDLGSYPHPKGWVEWGDDPLWKGWTGP